MLAKKDECWLDVEIENKEALSHEIPRRSLGVWMAFLLGIQDFGYMDSEFWVYALYCTEENRDCSQAS